MSIQLLSHPGLEDEGSLVVDVDDSGTQGQRAKPCQAQRSEVPLKIRGFLNVGYLKTMAFNTKRLETFWMDDVGKPHFRKPPEVEKQVSKISA